MKANLFDRLLIPDEWCSETVINRFLPHTPADKFDLSSVRRHLLRHPGFPRQAVADLLTSYNQAIGNHENSLINCRRLNDPQATIIITGQQAGLASGPLYTLYKIITTLKLAAFYESRWLSPVIPIFWNATEDHDLSEISTIDFPAQKWRVNLENHGKPVESLKTFPAFAKTINEFTAAINEANHQEAITALLRPSHEHYGELSSAIIARLLGDAGLVILEPRILRSLAGESFAKAVGMRHQINSALQSAGNELRINNIEPAFPSDATITGLYFISEDGTRQRLGMHQQRLTLGRKQFAESTILKKISQHPERCSASAFLRPIIQSSVLPVIGSVVGPGEYRYHLQLSKLFGLFNVAMPVLFMRNHGTILSRKEAKLAEKLALRERDYFQPRQKFYQRRELPEEIQKFIADAHVELEEHREKLQQKLPGLMSPALHAFYARGLNHNLVKLTAKIEKEYLRSGEVDNGRVDRFFACVQPKNKPQERVINILYFIQFNGLELIDHLLALFDPFEKRHYIVYTDY